MKRSFALVEVVVVIVILGILATLGLTQYGSARERVLDKEASANLRLIQAGQRIWNMEEGVGAGVFYNSGAVQLEPGGAITNINDNLRLVLPITANRSWNYITRINGCSQATRNGGNNRIWSLTINDGITGGDGEPDTGACT